MSSEPAAGGGGGVRPTLLLLSGGSQVAQYVLTALDGRRDLLRLVATSSIADDPGLWRFDKVYLAPVTAKEPAAFRGRLLEIDARECPDLIMPCRDDDVVALAELAEARPHIAPRSLCGSAAVARMICDKWQAALFCDRHGLPYARSMIAGSEASPEQFAREVGYPLVIKPRDGFGSHGVFLIENDEQLRRALERPNYVIQEYLDPPENYWAMKRTIDTDGLPLFHTLHGLKHSIELMIAKGGRVTRVFATCNAHAFRVSRIRPNDDAATLALGRRCGEVFAAAGWRGPLNIQCQRDRRGRVTIHEFNGRFSAATAARAMLGYDEVAHGVELFTGIRLPPTEWQARPATHVVSQLVARASHPADVERLQTDGEWSARGNVGMAR
jgi:carbamoyl-phosphate synthase large subunit